MKKQSWVDQAWQDDQLDLVFNKDKLHSFTHFLKKLLKFII